MIIPSDLIRIAGHKTLAGIKTGHFTAIFDIKLDSLDFCFILYPPQ
jgi:hypothetical protein